MLKLLINRGNIRRWRWNAHCIYIVTGITTSKFFWPLFFVRLSMIVLISSYTSEKCYYISVKLKSHNITQIKYGVSISGLTINVELLTCFPIDCSKNPGQWPVNGVLLFWEKLSFLINKSDLTLLCWILLK